MSIFFCICCQNIYKQIKEYSIYNSPYGGRLVMKKYKILFVSAAILLVLVSIAGGCTYDPARRYIQTDPNNMADPNTPTIPNNVVGRTGDNANGNRISATYEVVDFSYITINSDSLNVRSGAGAKYPSVGSVKSGQKIRALGKLDKCQALWCSRCSDNQREYGKKHRNGQSCSHPGHQHRRRCRHRSDRW
jgi:hypothetical protein